MYKYKITYEINSDVKELEFSVKKKFLGKNMKFAYAKKKIKDFYSDKSILIKIIKVELLP